MTALSIVIPTQGRDCLPQALGSIREQADRRTVEIIVVGDTHAAPDLAIFGKVASWCREFDALYMAHDAGFNHWGHPQAQHVMPLASGARLAFLGDDDIYLPGALELMTHCTAALSLFRAEMRKLSRPVWEERGRLACGQISAQCIVVKNDRDHLGTWGTGPEREGDWAFIRSTVDRWGGDAAIDWRGEVIAECH